jgi:hypothetical protein
VERATSGSVLAFGGIFAAIWGGWRSSPYTMSATEIWPRGATEKKPRENDVHLRQLAKTSTYVLFFFFLVRFWAFLGKGVRKHEENKLSTFQKNRWGTGKYFFGGDFFPGDFF